MSARRTAALAVGLAAAGTVVARQLVRRGRGALDLPGPITSRLGRTTEVARISSRTGGAYALHKARRAFADAERRRHLDFEFEMRTAAQVAETLGNMRGALMKLGQMASYLDQGLPQHVREALAELQSNAPPMSGELAARVIERELGRPPDQVFQMWDEVPIASASIGQVHRAITHDDRAVAVKVQYPGIDEAIAADLDNAGLLVSGLGLLFPGLEPGPLVDELRARVVEELDYVLEASNQQLFADAYRGHPTIHVPDVLPELSSRRVLTTELAGGEPFEVAKSWPAEQRDLVGETIFRFVFRSLYRLRAFNGDPHPGNYLVNPDGRVTFLDFGLVKRFDHGEVEDFSAMVRSLVVDRDVAAFRREVERIGLLRPGAPFGDALVGEYFGHFYEWVMEDRPSTVTAEYASESVRRIFDASGPYGEIMRAANIPPSFVIIQRINLGLYAVMAELGATRNWRRIAEELWPWVDGPASTSMGEAEQEWLRRRA